MVCGVCGCSFESLDSTAVDKELFDSAECEDFYWSGDDDYYEDYVDEYLYGGDE
jgi:hypothetical protein